MDISVSPQPAESPSNKSGFQTFLMTGDAIIQVDTHPKPKTPKTIKTETFKLDLNGDTSKQIKQSSQDTQNSKPGTAVIVITDDSKTEPSQTNGSLPYDNTYNDTPHNKREFVPGFMRPEEDAMLPMNGPPSPEPLGRRDDSITGSSSSLGSLDDISLDMNNLVINTTQVDEPSAFRLAKRLYNLEGFKRSDVSYHLTRNNQFSQKVAEEYLKYFDFTGLMLVEAMRMFFSHFALTGETQERERVLAHFTHRYISCNPNTLNDLYKSEDSCHTLICALMLLNTDLHGQNVGKRMTLQEFVENLAGFNHNSNFPKEFLKACYNSIRNQPFSWAYDDEVVDSEKLKRNSNGTSTPMPSHLKPTDHPVLPKHQTLPANSFISIPDSGEGQEFKRGTLIRKCCRGPEGTALGLGKRGWKRFFVILKDMVLYLLKSEKSSLSDSSTKVILIHHSLAGVARHYKKKPFVFSLHTADWSEYLFSTNAGELEDWVNTINLVTATMSSEPLAAAVGSQKKFHRPLLPSAHTGLSLGDQCRAHEAKLAKLKDDLMDEEQHRPDRNSSKTLVYNYKEKLAYLKYELQRYVIYAQLLRAKLDQFPDLDINIANAAIGEVDEPTPSVSSGTPSPNPSTKTDTALETRSPGNSDIDSMSSNSQDETTPDITSTCQGLHLST